MNIRKQIESLENKNKSVKVCTNVIRRVHTYGKRLKLFPGEFLRGIGVGDKRFEELKKYKNLYPGERCFIIATGPSLREEDVLSLSNEYTFGMNSICKLFSKYDWRPTFFGIQDLFVYDKLSDDLSLMGKAKVLVGNNIAIERNVEPTWIRFPLNSAYNEYQQFVEEKFPVRFSDDCYKVVYNGFSITYSLIQIAVYMGFKEIYLLGTDCTFSKTGKNHFAEHGHIDNRVDTAQERNFSMYRCAKEYTDAHGVRIFNATRGGALEIFERVDFDTIKKK